jgi:hypothetical protein
MTRARTAGAASFASISPAGPTFSAGPTFRWSPASRPALPQRATGGDAPKDAPA